MDRATRGTERHRREVETWKGRVPIQEKGKKCESLMLCSVPTGNAIQTLGLAITTELLKYLLQVKRLVLQVKNNRE